MELIKNKSFGGERPLFGAHDVRLEDITITDGESGIKCCQNIECHHSKFYGKYPWWHVDGSLITDCYFAPESRSAIWYSDNMVMKDCTIDGPKFFREMKNLDLENVNITDADETFWKVPLINFNEETFHVGKVTVTYPPLMYSSSFCFLLAYPQPLLREVNSLSLAFILDLAFGCTVSWHLPFIT